MSPEHRADVTFFLAIAIGVLFIALLGPLDRRLEMVHANDFSGFWAGPRAVLEGVSPWDPTRYPQMRVVLDTQRDDAPVLNYMPWVVLGLMPLGLLPLELAAWIWMLASMTAATLALRALLREFAPGRPPVHGALGLALFIGQPGFHAIVLGQWSPLLMSAVAAIVLALRAGHARRAAVAALALLAKPQLFVWTAVGLAIPAFVDERYRRFVRYALLFAGVVVVGAWLVFPDWFPAWASDIPQRRTGRSAVLFSAFGELFGGPGRVLAILVILAGVAVATRFRPGSDPWLAAWLGLSGAGAIYSWSYDHLLLFVPIVITCGVLLTRGRERAATRFALAAAATFVLVSPLFYAIGVIRHDETFSIAVPVALFVAMIWLLWPHRADSAAHASEVARPVGLDARDVVVPRRT